MNKPSATTGNAVYVSRTSDQVRIPNTRASHWSQHICRASSKPFFHPRLHPSLVSRPIWFTQWYGTRHYAITDACVVTRYVCQEASYVCVLMPTRVDHARIVQILRPRTYMASAGHSTRISQSSLLSETRCPIDWHSFKLRWKPRMNVSQKKNAAKKMKKTNSEKHANNSKKRKRPYDTPN